MKLIPGTLSALLLILFTFNASAQELVFCPVTPAELNRRCARSADEIRTLATRIAETNRRLQDPDIVLAKVERQAGESVEAYRLRVTAQEGVPAPKSNTWLPLQGYFFNPESQACFVAMLRRDYWRYVWESLGQDLDLAQRTFAARERLSLREKQQQRINATWGVGRWEADLTQLNQFRIQCCREQDDGATGPPPSVAPPGFSSQPEPSAMDAADPVTPGPLDGKPGRRNP
jgi:hypothetical protein